MKTRYLISAVLLTILVLSANCYEIKTDQPPTGGSFPPGIEEYVSNLYITNTFELGYTCVVYEAYVASGDTIYTSVINSDSTIHFEYSYFSVDGITLVGVRFQENIVYLESEVVWDTTFIVESNETYYISN